MQEPVDRKEEPHLFSSSISSSPSQVLSWELLPWRDMCKGPRQEGRILNSFQGLWVFIASG